MSDVEPRWLDVDGASKRMCMRADAFMRAVKRGKLPPPSYAIGERSPRWDRDALDAKMEGARRSTIVRIDSHALAEKIANEGRKSRKAQAA